MMPLGDSRLSTMVVGCIPDIGRGRLVRFTFVQFMLQLWSPGLAARAGELDSHSVMATVGVHSGTESRSFPGIAEAVTISVM